MPSLPYGPSPRVGWACGILAHSRTGPAVDWSARRNLLQRGALGKALARRILRPGASSLRHLVCRASSWPGKEGGARQPVRSQLKAAAHRLAYLWQNSIKTMQIGSVRTALAVAILMVGTLTAAANVWGVKRINHRSLSRVGPQASDLLGREVTVGQVNWLAPTGVTGLHPIASLGPVSVGPGATEGSWAHLPEVRVSLDPLKSLVQRKVVLKLHAPGAEVDLVQASNLSWFGYPDDTIPSARNFLPGFNKGGEPNNTSTAEGAELHQAAIEAYMKQAAAKQAEKDLQRQQAPVPPDAAVNFSPAVGRDLICEGLAKPRAKSKPAFTTAAGNPHPHPHPSHSVAHSLSPIAIQAPASSAPARTRHNDADADEERRASGQAASTSGPSSRAPWDHPVPSTFPKSPSKGRGSPPSSPFASITMGEPRSCSFFRSHAVSADDPVAQRSDQAPQDRRCSDVSSDHVGTQKRIGRRRRGTSSAQAAIRKPVPNNADMAAGLESADPEHQASAPSQALPEQRGSDASRHCQSTQHPSTLAAACSPCSMDSTGALPANSATTKRHGVTTHGTSKGCNPIAALAQNTDKPQASSATHSAAAADDAASWHSRRKKHHARKPGPSAFPQLPHEHALQSQSSCIGTHCTSPPSPEPPEARAKASDMPRQAPAQTDQLADAMQQRLWRLQMDQVRAEEEQRGGQQHLSQHGGYMQRGGQERLSRRRTTRSLLRGADVQTGDPIDEGLAAYYASALPESALHPAWSLYHQQQAGALSPAKEAAADAAPALTHNDADTQYHREHQGQQQAAGSWSVAASHSRGAARDDAASVDKGNMQGSAQPTRQSGNRLQQSLAKAMNSISQTLEQGKAEAERIRSSSAKLVRDRGLPWASPQNWAPAPWAPSQVNPTWPTQPVNPVLQTPYIESVHHPAVEATNSTPSLTSVPLPQSNAADSVAQTSSSIDGQKTRSAVDMAAEVADLSSEANQLLASFRLHRASDPCVLTTFDSVNSSRQGHLRGKLSYAKPSAHAVQSSVSLPDSVIDGKVDASSLQHRTECDHDPHQPSAHDDIIFPDDAEGARAAQMQIGDPLGDMTDPKQQPGILPADPGPSASSSRAARSRAGSVVGREDMVVEPKYTPGVPPPPRGTLQISATADARLQRWIGQFGRAVLSKVRMPGIALDSLAIKRSEVNAWVAGETVPRHFEQVDAVVQLARDYQGLEVHLSALAHERDPAQDKCTTLNPNATRNLRGTTAQQQPLQAVMPDVGSNPTEASLPGTPLGAEEGPQQANWGWRHHRQQRQRPTGGRFHVHATSDGLKKDAETFPDLLVTLRLQGLHAPLAERFVELPVDITAGRLDGELKVHCHDAATWKFPSFAGQVACRGLDFHFWDAVDDLSKTNIDLVFDDQRLYMHNAIGMFGSVPLTLSGDVGINPDSGQYRLSGEVAGVEVNELRKTLGVRPTPYSVGGAVRGVLHVTGPLDQPIFSGTAVATAPSKSMLELSEDCDAKSTLVQTQGCVGAYDKMPLASASCLFTMDTSSDIFIMHSFQAEPVGGGKMLGSGRMWVAQAALDNPNAVKMTMRGQGLPTEALLKRYLPSGTVLPKALTLGPGEVQGSMEGSHTNPTVHATWQVPVAHASGQVKLDKDSMHLSAKSPALDVSGILHMRPPPPEKIRAAVTQAEMTAVSVPVLEGAEVDANFKGLDVMPVVSPATAENRPSLGQPTRLRLTGRTKLSGRLSPQPDQAVPATQLPASAFEGDVLLDGLRVNQLKLSRNLTGSLQVSEKEVHMHAKGSRPDESLDMDLALPLFQPQPTPEPQQIQTQSMGGLLPSRLAGVADLLPVPRFAPSSLLPGARKASTAGPSKPSAAPGMGEGGTFSLRCGQLSISAQVNASSSLVDAAVMGLKLDELELASLRGEVQEVSLSLNFDTRMGRGKVSVAGPRFSGLQGEALSGGVRWERDVIRLEKAVLQQRSSRYEVQGEYVIPPDTHIPDSAASMAPMELMGSRSGAPLKPPKSAFGQATGRWRLQVAVPQADMEEILPAARLLSRATAVTPSDYDRAKTLFLAGLHDAGMQAQSLVHQLEEAAKQARQQARNLQEAIPTSPHSVLPSTAPEATAETGPGKGPTARGNVPGLQDLKGSWSGAFQAYGGGGGAANTDFDVKGADWQWGNYRMDQVVAIGSCHSNEGLKLEEVALRAEDAKLLLRGGLLGPHQNATLMLTDFPVALLQPLFRAVPALEHAAPAVGTSSEGLGLGASPGAPFHGLNMAFSRTGRAHALIPADTLYSNSPVNGLLFVHGIIGGSASIPEGEIVVRLFEGAIGPTRLAQATATACLDSQQRLAFDCHLEPAQARQTGHVKLSGSLPLTFTNQPSAVEKSELDDAVWEETGDAAPEGSQETAPALGPQDVEAALHVKDAGMMLVSTVAPDFTWQSGNADIAIRVSGQQEQPIIEGSAQLRKAAIYCPHFKYPMTNVHADINMANNHLQVEGLEARVGRRGHIKVRGGLPVTPSSTSVSPAGPAVEPSGTDRGAVPEGINVAVQGLELRVRNVYTGHLDADLQLQQSLMQPEVGGVMRFSRGVAYLNPQGPSPTGQGSAEAGAQEADLVAQAFSALQARKEGAANGLVRQQSRPESLQLAEVALVQPAVAERVVLQGLTIQLGPDLRTTYPVVMNFNISGQVDITGPPDANKLQLQGTIKLDSGEVNLVATQLVLDREHTNRLVFVDGQGLDPNMDLKFRGPNLRALIQGPASSWQSHLTLTPTGGSGGEGTEQLDPSQAAKIFEGQLASALVAEDGQLALSNLAQSAAHAVMPKLQTQGQLGQARWRLVSAPSIPGLLSLDPIGDPTSLLSSLTMGTEVEVQFGKSLQATMARKLRDSDIATQWTLNYQLNTKLRMQFNISSSTPYPRTLVFQYSGEGGPRP